jgi:hypothetical protein
VPSLPKPAPNSQSRADPLILLKILYIVVGSLQHKAAPQDVAPN